MLNGRPVHSGFIKTIYISAMWTQGRRLHCVGFDPWLCELSFQCEVRFLECHLLCCVIELIYIYVALICA